MGWARGAGVPARRPFRRCGRGGTRPWLRLHSARGRPGPLAEPSCRDPGAPGPPPRGRGPGGPPPGGRGPGSPPPGGRAGRGCPWRAVAAGAALGRGGGGRSVGGAGFAALDGGARASPRCFMVGASGIPGGGGRLKGRPRLRGPAQGERPGRRSAGRAGPRAERSRPPGVVPCGPHRRSGLLAEEPTPPSRDPRAYTSTVTPSGPAFTMCVGPRCSSSRQAEWMWPQTTRRGCFSRTVSATASLPRCRPSLTST